MAKLIDRTGISEGPNIIASLFERYQSIEGIFCALIDSLADVPPTTAKQAFCKPDLAHMLISLAKADSEAPKIGDALFTYLIHTLGNRQDEALLALFLDMKANCIDAQILAHGGDREVSIGTRRLLRAAIQCRATSIILAHNHPSGNLTPSVVDYISTAAAKDAAESVGIDLIDHFIVAGDLIFSIRQSRQVAGK